MTQYSHPRVLFIVICCGILAVALQGESSAIQPQQRPCIDINTASGKDLERIIHIGAERASQIIALRKERLFRTVDELVRVKGIAEARLADIKREGLACVRR